MFYNYVNLKIKKNIKNNKLNFMQKIVIRFNSYFNKSKYIYL